jgi:hypothetical protein
MKFREQRGKISGKEALLKNHPDLTHLMRAKLINWIFEVIRKKCYFYSLIILSYLIFFLNR